MCHDEVDSLTDYLAKIIFESFSEMNTEFLCHGGGGVVLPDWSILKAQFGNVFAYKSSPNTYF